LETGLRQKSADAARFVANWPDRQEKLLEASGKITQQTSARETNPRFALCVLRHQKPLKDENQATLKTMPFDTIGSLRKSCNYSVISV
jgi:hypothetical protein